MDKMYFLIMRGASKSQREQFLKFKEPYVKQAWLRYIKKLEGEN